MIDSPDNKGVTAQPSFNATIRHLRAFLSVARYRSFTRAAADLHLSQPSLTMTIKQLEDIVGAHLFDRTTRNVVLTPEGDDLLPMALRLVEDFDVTMSNIRLTASSRNSCLRLAMVHSIATKIVPQILDGFLSQHPGLRVQIREGNSAEVRRMVLRNEADVGFCSKEDDEAELHFEPLFTDQLGLFAKNGHPLLQKPATLRWSEITDYDFIGLTQDTATGPILSHIHLLPETVRVPKYEVSTVSALEALLENGLGVTTVPALAAEFLTKPSLQFRGLEEPVAWRIVHRVTRIGRALPSMIEKFIKAIEAEVERISTDHQRIRYLK